MAKPWFGCRLGPKLVNRCRPEKKDTKEHGKTLKTILEVAEGRVPHKGGQLNEKRTATMKEC